MTKKESNMKISKKNKDQYSIGDRFILEDGIELECVEETCSCIGCYFYGMGINCNSIKHIIGYCSIIARDDLEGVIFKKVKP